MAPRPHRPSLSPSRKRRNRGRSKKSSTYVPRVRTQSAKSSKRGRPEPCKCLRKPSNARGQTTISPTTSSVKPVGTWMDKRPFRVHRGTIQELRNNSTAHMLLGSRLCMLLSPHVDLELGSPDQDVIQVDPAPVEPTVSAPPPEDDDCSSLSSLSDNKSEEFVSDMDDDDALEPEWDKSWIRYQVEQLERDETVLTLLTVQLHNPCLFPKATNKVPTPEEARGTLLALLWMDKEHIWALAKSVAQLPRIKMLLTLLRRSGIKHPLDYSRTYLLHKLQEILSV